MTNIFKRILGLAGFNAISQIIQFVILVFLARDLGPDELGKLFVGLVTANVIFATFDFGASTYFTRGLAKGEISLQQFSDQFRVRLVLFAALSSAVGLVACALDNQWLIATAAVAFSQFVFQGLQSVARSQKSVMNLSFGIVSDRVICFLSVTILIALTEMTANLALICWALGQVFGSMVLFLSTIRGAERGKRPSIKVAMNINRHKQLGYFSIANVLMTLDQALLGQISGTRQTGLIGSVSKWFTPVAMLSSSASLVVSNHSIRTAANARSAIRQTSRVWFVMALFSLAVGTCSWFMAPLVDLLLGNEYREAQALVGILGVGAAIAFVNQPLASLLQYFDGEKYVARTIWATGICYLALLSIALFLLPSQGALVLAYMQVFLQISILATLLIGVMNSSSK